MKQIYFFLIFALLFISCKNPSRSNDSGVKKIITVTIEPQRFFVDNLVNDAFSVNTLVPPGSSPETYEPSPSVMINLSKSDIYFRVGDLGFENAWSEKLAKNNPNVLIVNCSDGIELMGGHEHCETHHHDHSHGVLDPHVWSSPAAMRIFATNMLNAIVDADPENEEKYRANFENLTEIINNTDSTIRSILNDVSSRAFIIYHPALGYFAEDYGLHQYSIEFEGKNPSPAQMKNLVDMAKQENIKIVFVQRGFDMKNAEVVAREIGAEVHEIDPLSYQWDTELIRIANILARK